MLALMVSSTILFGLGGLARCARDLILQMMEYTMLGLWNFDVFITVRDGL
jgi:hypothetical protein